jgi:glycosyltransferase involved in cell wall biosynthesis
VRIAFANSARIWGGAEKMTETLARGLASRGHRVVLLCRAGSPLMRRLGDEIPCEAIRGGFDLNPRAVAGCALALCRHRPELLMTMTQKDPRIAGVAARLLGVPVVVRHPMDVPFQPRLDHRFYFGWLPAHLIANSHATRRTMLASAPWLSPADVTTIHNGLEVERIRTAEPAALGLPRGAVAIGFAGRFETRKGAVDLADAWPRIAAAVPAAHLVLVGAGGAQEAELRQRLPESSRIRWLGFRGDVAAVMKALDVVVVPSHYEGFGLVLAEAMAAGTAVVASRATNFPELVDHGVEGLLFQVGDPGALAQAVVSLAEDPEARRRMGAAGVERVRRDFTVERMLARYERALAGVIEAAAEPVGG